MEILVINWWTKKSSIFNARRSTSFRILCCVLGRSCKIPNLTKHGSLGWITSSQSYRNFDRIDGEPTEFEWDIFPGFHTLQLSDKVKSLLCRLRETPENFTGGILFMSIFSDISCGTKDNEKECLANARLVSLYARKFGKGQWSFIGPGSEKKWYSMKRGQSTRNLGSHRGQDAVGIRQKAGVQFSVQQLHCPEVDSKAKDTVNCRFTLRPSRKRLRLFFA